jgi:mono/diheme cytochrome c family protein
MNHRAVARVVRLVLALFVASGLVFALAVRGPAPSGQAIPATHRGFGEGTCATCHRGPAVAAPPAARPSLP